MTAVATLMIARQLPSSLRAETAGRPSLGPARSVSGIAASLGRMSSYSLAPLLRVMSLAIIRLDGQRPKAAPALMQSDVVAAQMVCPRPLVPGISPADDSVPASSRTITPVPKSRVPTLLTPASRQSPSAAQPTPYRYSVPGTTVVVPALPPVSVATMPCSVAFSPTATQLPTVGQSMPFRYQPFASFTAACGVPDVIGTIAGT